MNKGYLITIEGGEGSGKSTQARLLNETLQKRKLPVVMTREPGGTALAETIRKILLDPHSFITPLAELLLYEAGRAQHTEEIIEPALSRGAIVICDRFTDATIAYQGFGRGLPLNAIRAINAIAAKKIVPDLTIYLDIPVAKGLSRARSILKDDFTSGAGDRLEQEAIAFHRRVHKGYRAQARAFPRRIVTIPTAVTPEKTHKAIMTVVERRLARKGF